ncbi:MAG: tail fiber domain-containing protein [Bacteroidia bacterium]|nr:tail fiber domain-containing protein [Bacteroidia bacterium]
MKQKIVKAAGLLIMALLAPLWMFSQGNTYKLDGNNNGSATSKLGYTNAADLKLITRDSVRQTITKNGDVIIEKNLNVKGSISVNNSSSQPVNINGDVTIDGNLKADSLYINRILPAPGDSIINFGPHTVQLNTAANRISWTLVPGAQCGIGVRGLSIGNGPTLPVAWGLNSFAIGGNTFTQCPATNSFAMGYGVSNGLPNTFMLGFSGVTLFVNNFSVGIGTITPAARLHVFGANGFIQTDPLGGASSAGALPLTDGLVVANGSGKLYTKIRFNGNQNQVLSGDGTFITLPTPTTNAWTQGGNFLFPNPSDNILGILMNNISLDIWSGNNLRQHIDGTSGLPTSGFIGFGGIAAPKSALHLTQGPGMVGDIFTQYTNNLTGNAAGNGFRLGVLTTGEAMIMQQEDAPMKFVIGSSIGPVPCMKIRNNVGWIGIGFHINDWVQPQNLVHLWDKNQVYTQFTNSATSDTLQPAATDGFLVGIDKYANAILNQQENLPMLFYTNGGEKMRIENNNAYGDGFVGVGTAFTDGLQPKRRLDSYEHRNPQLRLTQDLDSLTIDGTFTDFQTAGPTSVYSPATNMLPGPEGHLLINPRFKQIKRVVAINWENTTTIINPDLSLDVNGQQNIRSVNQNDTLTHILVWDSAYEGRIRWRNVNTFGFGAMCGSPAPYNLTSNWRIGLANHNFYFAGQGTANNSVGIGYDCVNLSAKLDVWQKSDTANTIGILVTNNDLSSGISTSPFPVIGLKSILPIDILHLHQYYKVAGWFEAPEGPAANSQYAIFVPKFGGSVSLGFTFNAASPNYLLQVNGSAAKPGSNLWTVISDIQLKKDTSAFTDGLNVIRKIHPINYRYNGLAGIDTSIGMQVGISAQEVQNFAPYTIGTFKAKLNETDANYTDLLSFNAGPLMFASFNAIQELDSTVTKLDSIVKPFVNPPLPPVLISPENNATAVPLETTFSWHRSKKTISFKFSLSTTPDMTGIIKETTTIDTIVNISPKDVPVNYSSTYYWSVIAINDNGNSEPSEIWSFTTEPAPLPPVLISPVNGAIIAIGSVEFMWQPSSGATSYKIFLSTSPDEIDIIDSQDIDETTWRCKIFDYQKTFYWWVKPCKYVVAYGEKSEVWNFTTVAGFASVPPEISDAALKTNVAPFTGALSKVEQLNGIYFDWDTLQYPNLDFESGRQIGLIAQDVQPVIPEVVKVDKLGYRYISYNRFVPVLIEAVKELNSKNTQLTTVADSLKNVIASYETRFASIESILANCCQNPGAKSLQGDNNAGQSSVVSDALSLSKGHPSSVFENTEISTVIHITPDSSVNSLHSGSVNEKITELYQNRPNPFTVKTTFTYTLGKTGFVELEIHSELGMFITKLVNSNQSEGNYSIDWDTADLAPGIYFYSLKVDGMLWVKKAVRIK